MSAATFTQESQDAIDAITTSIGELDAFYLLVVGVFVFFMQVLEQQKRSPPTARRRHHHPHAQHPTRLPHSPNPRASIAASRAAHQLARTADPPPAKPLLVQQQAGFALLEAGSVRSKNTRNILLKNLLDACIGAIIWWAFGMGIAYGDSGSSSGNVFIGTGSNGAGPFFAAGWGSSSAQSNGYTMALWFFQYVFAAAAATIVSGAVAERAQLSAYLIYTCIITGFIYPIVVHWVWCNNGFLSGGFTSNKNLTVLGGCLDFAGSGVVHMTGGVAALCAAAIIQPRIGRFDENGKPNAMPGHSTPFVVLGTLILWMGWYGFNPGSTLGITTDGYGTIMARCAMCTTLSAAAGGLTCVFFDRIFSKTFDVSMVCNGILAGLVSITAGCAATLPWAALVIGFIGAFVYYGAHTLMLNLQVRDRPQAPRLASHNTPLYLSTPPGRPFSSCTRLL